MPATTTRLALPYPVPADTVDVPRDVKALADALAPVTTSFAQGTLASRPAPGTAGRLYYATDTDELFYDDGTVFNPITPGSGSAGGGGQLPVLDVGMVGQIRAGRQLTVADFTNMGLSTPVGLFNLSDLTNLGSGGALVNKGAVPFGAGINGLASTSAVFAGSVSQALYVVDTGASDPFRIRTGSFGCWFRTAKRGVDQWLVSKWGGSDAVASWGVQIASTNVARTFGDVGTVGFNATGVSDVCDDRWHHAVATCNATEIRIYVDGVLEASGAAQILNGNASAPMNIGAFGADSGAAATFPHYGRVDEAFITHDTLTEDQIRNLYCARLPHSLPATPTRVSLNVTRRRRGGALATTDFPAQPVRLYNFTGGALADQGSNSVTLTGAGGGATSVAGAEGLPLRAFSFAGTGSLQATDAGLPAALTPRSYGCWFKTTSMTTGGLVGWGTSPSAYAIVYSHTDGRLYSESGADQMSGVFVCDGQWHFVVVSEDNAAGDGVKRKLYLDGRMVGGSTVMNSITLAGADRFRVGAGTTGTIPFTGQIDGAFVTNTALTPDQVAKLYSVGTQPLPPSPKEEGAHIEALQATDILATFDTLQSCDQVDILVAS